VFGLSGRKVVDVAAPDPVMLYADRILIDGWCLRSALVRYAQAEAHRSTVLHALLRRFDAAWPSASGDLRAGLLSVAARFEVLAVAMSEWAADRSSHAIPTPLVDAVCTEVAGAFERLGVPEESNDPAEWRGMRGAEGRRPKAAGSPKAAPPAGPTEPAGSVEQLSDNTA
jgi:hypothetical protein